MKFNKFLIEIMLLIVIVLVCSCSKKKPNAPEGSAVIFAGDIKIASIDSGLVNASPEYMMFSALVVNSATEILAKTYSISNDEAKSLLSKHEYMIYTTMDINLQSKLDVQVNNIQSTDNMMTEAAILDTGGKVLSVSSSLQSQIGKHQIGSTMKPLGVYAPAIENNTITYSSMFEDSPITQIKDENGKAIGWPSNATGICSGQSISVEEAIARSLNTIAVRVLDKSGIDNSKKFLTEKLGLSIDVEQSEKLDNMSTLAFGYITPGLTTVDLAGYYTMFENDGLYQKPFCITKITSADETIYLHKDDQKRVISSTTSSIMKHLLENVVDDEAGTGHNAKMDIDIACKTGTTNNNMDNWCVGFSSYYVCGIWSGYSDNIERHLTSNPSVSSFKNVMTSIHENKPVTPFSYNDKVVEKAYDIYTGELAGPNCKMTKIGYYSVENIPKICTRH